jgi:hypothetical protein
MQFVGCTDNPENLRQKHFSRSHVADTHVSELAHLDDVGFYRVRHRIHERLFRPFCSNIPLKTHALWCINVYVQKIGPKGFSKE